MKTYEIVVLQEDSDLTYQSLSAKHIPNAQFDYKYKYYSLFQIHTCSQSYMNRIAKIQYTGCPRLSNSETNQNSQYRFQPKLRLEGGIMLSSLKNVSFQPLFLLLLVDQENCTLLSRRIDYFFILYVCMRVIFVWGSAP